jgi:hypothetical protein
MLNPNYKNTLILIVLLTILVTIIIAVKITGKPLL